MTVPPSNPFVSRCVRPGAVPYLFFGNSHVHPLITALRAQRWTGQIVGPHGSGKSTLIETLMEPLQRAGRKTVRYRFSSGTQWGQIVTDGDSLATSSGISGQSAVNRGDELDWDGNTQVVVDGFEQVPAWRRVVLYSRCLRNGSGLLVTTHRRLLTLPLLIRTGVDLTTACEIVQRLTGGGRIGEITDQDVSEYWRIHRGNMREVLFSLYDLYELRSTEYRVRTRE